MIYIISLAAQILLNQLLVSAFWARAQARGMGPLFSLLYLRVTKKQHLAVEIHEIGQILCKVVSI